MCKTCYILVCRGVNSNVISWNRVILLHGKSNLFINSSAVVVCILGLMIYELTHPCTTMICNTLFITISQKKSRKIRCKYTMHKNRKANGGNGANGANGPLLC